MSYQRFAFVISGALLVAGCATEQNPTVVTANGDTKVTITAGLNCYDNKCFRYNPSSGTISVNGRRDTRPPAGVSLSSGAISPSAFKATFDTGVRAPTLGGSER